VRAVYQDVGTSYKPSENNMKTTNNNQSMTEKTPRHKKNDTNCFSLVRSVKSVQLRAAVTVTIDHSVGARTIV